MKTKWEPQIGEECVVYAGDRYTGTIVSVGGIRYEVDIGMPATIYVHRNQLRPLRKAREWRMLYKKCDHENMMIVSSHVCREWFVEGPKLESGQIITVREVRRK